MPGVPDARRDAVLRRYPLRRLRLPLGSGQLSLVVPDDRAWLREGSWAPAVARGKEPPYWIRIWPAAVAIARLLERSPEVRDVRVLDLGCGIGVPGVVAARRGARVQFADREPDALRFATWNARANQCAGAPDPVGLRIDWARDIVPGAFDLILLSDVTYHESHHAPVRRQLRVALAEGGAVLHAEPQRVLSGHFLDSLAREGFVSAQWRRDTAFVDLRAQVRLTLLAREGAALSAWRARLGVPATAVSHTELRGEGQRPA